ncbi:hypothetical protein PF003_g32281 [Phytophthora fragariae]|nr:hypothetical protein PF003_g32281 [Phytophthora fragariae]
MEQAMLVMVVAQDVIGKTYRSFNYKVGWGSI